MTEPHAVIHGRIIRAGDKDGLLRARGILLGLHDDARRDLERATAMTESDDGPLPPDEIHELAVAEAVLDGALNRVTDALTAAQRLATGWSGDPDPEPPEEEIWF